MSPGCEFVGDDECKLICFFIPQCYWIFKTVMQQKSVFIIVWRLLPVSSCVLEVGGLFCSKTLNVPVNGFKYDMSVFNWIVSIGKLQWYKMKKTFLTPFTVTVTPFHIGQHHVSLSLIIYMLVYTVNYEDCNFPLVPKNKMIFTIFSTVQWLNGKNWGKKLQLKGPS